MNPEAFTTDLLTVLAAGFFAGVVCKRLGVSMLVGYLAVGALIGHGALGLVQQQNHELEYLAHVGALLLLFAVGIEFSLGELVRMGRFFLIGGAAQLALAAGPLTAACLVVGMRWNAALLAGFAAALSSTVLVFKALVEWGQTATPHGRRAIAILLFQDVALVPLMLLAPLLTRSGEPPTVLAYALLAGKSLGVVALVILCRAAIERWAAPGLAKLRSVEIVALFALSLLGGACWGAHWLGLPTAIGALGAGIMLGGNRVSKQIDTIVLPFRETFAAVFFVTLGTLLDPAAFVHEPLKIMIGLTGALALKTAAAAVALRLAGLRWRSAWGMGLGLAQLGEFSFLLLAQGMQHGVVSPAEYNRLLFVALGSLLLTPLLLKWGLRWSGAAAHEPDEPASARVETARVQHALVIGVGLIGRQIASRLEMFGVDVCLIDLSPINLHPFAQQGFHTVAGDASDPAVLRRAGVARCRLAVISVPDDEAAKRIARAVRDLNRQAFVLVRCRYQSNTERVLRAGANAAVSEEAEASGALLRRCEAIVNEADSPAEGA